MFFVDQLIGTIKNANNKMKGDWIACWDWDRVETWTKKAKKT